MQPQPAKAVLLFVCVWFRVDQFVLNNQLKFKRGRG